MRFFHFPFHLRSLLPLLVTLILLLYLLLFPDSALSSARDGLLLWYHSVIPVLFPFMVLGGILLRLRPNAYDGFASFPLLRVLSSVLGCSKRGLFAVLIGFLCGFPMGARITCMLLDRHQITPDEAYHLYGFTNNPSPAFLISFVASDQLGCPEWKYLCLANVFGASILYGIIETVLSDMYRIRSHAAAPSGFSGKRMASVSVPDTAASDAASEPSSFFLLLDRCIGDAAQAAVHLGGIIVLFSILQYAFAILLPFDTLPILLFRASMELTNGVRLISGSALSFSAKFILLHALCGFGGFSALAQSASIAHMNPIVFRHYIKSRVCITLLSILLSSGSLIIQSLLRT